MLKIQVSVGDFLKRLMTSDWTAIQILQAELNGLSKFVFIIVLSFTHVSVILQHEVNRNNW
jgi:hypothetical protein